MSETLIHRGPDDQGVWTDIESRIGLGFRRLSILDTSKQGHQPMLSQCGRFVIAYNGEIYNFLALKKTLLLEQQAEIRFRSRSDTEVILTAFSHWGVKNTLPKLNGMFSMAIWDRKKRQLTLARDRMGKKPLYYGWFGNTFLFGSELKALRKHPAFQSEIDRDALALYLRHGYVPAPYSIYRGVSKLQPGQFLEIRSPQHSRAGRYYSPNEMIDAAKADPFTGTADEAIHSLKETLWDAVKIRRLSDVPLGAFLSGGIDSSLIVALMQAQSNKKIQTFTIGFTNKSYDESPFARQVAQHLGTEHTEFLLEPSQAIEAISRLPHIYDEPFSDSSQIPTLLVSELARKTVTVALSGDGGDELFSGYNRYLWGQKLWNRFGWWPTPLKSMTARTLKALSPQQWHKIYQLTQAVLPKRSQMSTPGDKIHKLAEALEVGNSPDDPDGLYYRIVSQWKDPTQVVVGSKEPPTLLTDRERWPTLPDFTERMMYLDMLTYLPDDILTKVDRASMGVSLEARAPLLDPRVVAFSWRLPLNLKYQQGTGKWLLRQLLYQYIPQEIMERPKMGFALPIGDWLRGPLRDWASRLLDPVRLKREGYFEPSPILERWRAHLSGKRNWEHSLWTIVMFQAWNEHLNQ